ncbi:MAG: AAA family ATPase [Pirellulales bacterium]|nr:AAA family ATPase [Pirellulales bacterium]
MGELVSALGFVILGVFVGIGGFYAYLRRKQSSLGQHDQQSITVVGLVRNHFLSTRFEDISVAERKFPFRVRADLQRAIDRLFDSDTVVEHFCGVRKEYAHDNSITLSDCFVESQHSPAVSVPPQYEEVDVGDAEPVRCLKNGLWFLRRGDLKYVVLLGPTGHYGQTTGVQFQIGSPNSPQGTKVSSEFFKHLEDSVLRAESYRGKILSMEESAHSYSGESSGIRVHQLRLVERDQVILSEKTLELLERNVLAFVEQRPKLASFRLATKKGILFYGPPGTGKTHTIHYLAKALPGHTTLLVTAEQVALLGEYMALARLLQPSIVVIEDVDLIARDRQDLNTCEEVLLNKLLNEMDGLCEEADILFILTTNRPEALEQALASRPGRIDQAIEFGLPDAKAREMLVRLYSGGVDVPNDVLRVIVERTDKVSAAFIKELMRRAVQFHLERNGTGRIKLQNIESALDEMLFSGGPLNVKLLGAAEANLAS